MVQFPYEYFVPLAHSTSKPGHKKVTIPAKDSYSLKGKYILNTTLNYMLVM